MHFYNPSQFQTVGLYQKYDMIFQIMAVLILIIFYAIYIGKMIAQRKKGIQTDQMARGKKSKNLLSIEITLKLATYSIVVIEILSIVINTTTPCFPVRIAGLVSGVLGVAIFGMAVCTMRDSWRAGIPEKDKTELVTKGIFKISRNPAFLAFDLVYFGVLFMFFNWILLLFTIWTVVMLHLQIKQEEKFLLSAFDGAYIAYKKKTRRYL